MIDHEFDSKQRFARVPLSIFQDRRLSAIDLCVLGYLLSRTANWTVSPSDVARVLCIDRRSAERSLDRLEQFGYSEPRLKVTAKRSRRIDSLISAVSKNPYVASLRQSTKNQSSSGVIVTGRNAAKEAMMTIRSGTILPINEAAMPLPERRASPTTYEGTNANTQVETQTELRRPSDADLMKEDSAEGAAAYSRVVSSLSFNRPKRALAIPNKGLIGPTDTDRLCKSNSEIPIAPKALPQESGPVDKGLPRYGTKECPF